MAERNSSSAPAPTTTRHPGAATLREALMSLTYRRPRRQPGPGLGIEEPPRFGELGQISAAPVAGLARHVFLSAGTEDVGPADQLQRELQAAGIRVWRDTTDLLPGDNQPTVIRRAITEAALIFLACFSSRSVAVVKSNLNAELQLAIDEQRKRRPDVTWLIPVRFDDCPVPDIDLGGGHTLTSLATADLFGPHREMEAGRLLAAIRRVLG